MLHINRILAITGLTHPRPFLTPTDHAIVFILHKRPRKAKSRGRTWHHRPGLRSHLKAQFPPRSTPAPAPHTVALAVSVTSQLPVLTGWLPHGLSQPGWLCSQHPVPWLSTNLTQLLLSSAPSPVLLASPHPTWAVNLQLPFPRPPWSPPPLASSGSGVSTGLVSAEGPPPLGASFGAPLPDSAASHSS